MHLADAFIQSNFQKSKREFYKSALVTDHNNEIHCEEPKHEAYIYTVTTNQQEQQDSQ